MKNEEVIKVLEEINLTPVTGGDWDIALSTAIEILRRIDVDSIRLCISEFTGFDSVKDRLSQAIVSYLWGEKLTNEH